MKKEIITCDIEDRNHSPNIKTYEMDVVFTTEQNEGRTTSPYIDREKIELCDTCRNIILMDRKMVEAQGAMGYNKYYL